MKKKKGFYAQCMRKIKSIFPNSKLKPLYSISNSIGDTAIIYGKLDLNELLEKVKNKFNNKEYKELKKYIKIYNDTFTLEKEYNVEYNFEYGDIRIDLIGTMFYNRKELKYKDIDEKLIDKFDKLGKDFIDNLYENLILDGQSYFYRHK